MGREKLSRRQFGEKIVELAGLALGLKVFSTADLFHSYTPAKDIEPPPGQIINALITQPDVGVYALPQDSAQFIPRNKLKVGAVVQLISLGNGWAQVAPEHGEFLWKTEDNLDRVYIKTSEITPITDFSPYSIYEDTTPQDKVIIVVEGYHPEFLMIEKGRVVGYVPTGIGGIPGDPSTFPGDYHANEVYVAGDMNVGLHGVPFIMFYNRTEGKAIHGAYWHDFNSPPFSAGWYGSSGCIGLASYSKNSMFNVTINETKVGLDQAVFRWALSLYPQFDASNTQGAQITYNMDTFYTSTLRVLVVPTIERLYDHTTDATGKNPIDWSGVIAQYELLHAGVFWMLPNLFPDKKRYFTLVPKPTT